MNDYEEKIIFEAIKEELKKFRNNSLYRCPDCGKIIEWDDTDYNPEESSYTCPRCGSTYDENDLEALSVYDIIEEMFLAFKEKNDEIDFDKH